jgi:hypothetical protein
MGWSGSSRGGVVAAHAESARLVGQQVRCPAALVLVPALFRVARPQARRGACDRSRSAGGFEVELERVAKGMEPARVSGDGSLGGGVGECDRGLGFGEVTGAGGLGAVLRLWRRRALLCAQPLQGGWGGWERGRSEWDEGSIRLSRFRKRHALLVS